MDGLLRGVRGKATLEEGKTKREEGSDRAIGLLKRGLRENREGSGRRRVKEER